MVTTRKQSRSSSSHSESNTSLNTIEAAPIMGTTAALVTPLAPHRAPPAGLEESVKGVGEKAQGEGGTRHASNHHEDGGDLGGDDDGQMVLEPKILLGTEADQSLLPGEGKQGNDDHPLTVPEDKAKANVEEDQTNNNQGIQEPLQNNRFQEMDADDTEGLDLDETIYAEDYNDIVVIDDADDDNDHRGRNSNHVVVAPAVEGDPAAMAFFQDDTTHHDDDDVADEDDAVLGASPAGRYLVQKGLNRRSLLFILGLTYLITMTILSYTRTNLSTPTEGNEAPLTSLMTPNMESPAAVPEKREPLIAVSKLLPPATRHLTQQAAHHIVQWWRSVKEGIPRLVPPTSEMVDQISL